MDFADERTLGRTGLKVGRLGIASSYGAPAPAFIEAFERGCNYFTWGSFIRGRSKEMARAIREIVRAGKRERLVLAMITYAHNNFFSERGLVRGLKDLGVDYSDVLILGYFSRRPSQRLINGALRLKERGLVRHLGLTGHNRSLFPRLAEQGVFDLFHIRYNAVHRGAETETFPYLTGGERPGVVTFTATRWGRLLNAKKMPPGESPPTAVDCYRFNLSHPVVDVCMTGAKTEEQMRENLGLMDTGPMTQRELERIRRIGDHLYH